MHCLILLAFSAAPFPPAEAYMPDVTPEDLVRFPDAECVSRNRDFCREHETWLEAQLVLYKVNARYWESRVVEARALRHPWEVLYQARQKAAYDREGCKEYLRDLRKELGPAAYYRGEMPPHVPWWKFEWR